MSQMKKLSLREINGELKIYFNWSANALMPINPTAADRYLIEHRSTIIKVAQKLLKQVSFSPAPIYRGIILRERVTSIHPHNNFQYLSFSTDRAVAEHFADVNGFGSDVVDVKAQLGEYGYVIEYTPKLSEILFHHRFLSLLPFDEAFTLIGIDGKGEVESLKKQKEIMIFQPAEPLTNITPK